MSQPNLPPLQRQITQAARRLFLLSFFTHLLWCWSGAFLMGALWFLVQPHLLPGLSWGWRVAGAFGLGGAGTVLAMMLAMVRAPSKLTAALLLDERFGLKERITTSLTLTAEQENSPAAQALLADANQRVDKLDVGSEFPVSVSWKIALVPLAAAGLAFLAFTYQPTITQAKPGSAEDLKKPPANAAEIDKKIADLKKKVETKKPTKATSEDLKRIEAELDKIANKPRDNKEQVRERIKEMTALEDAIKKREKELAEKTQAIQQQLQQMNRMAGTEAKEEGPAKDLNKALAQGDLEKAKEEVEKLAKRMENNEMTDQEKKHLAKQLNDLKKNLENLAQQKDKEENLKKLEREGKIDAETLRRELEGLKKDGSHLKDLQELAKKIGQCQKCLQEGDGKSASQSLKQATEKLQQMDLDAKEMEDLHDQLQRLQDAKDACCKGCKGEGSAGQGEQEQSAQEQEGGNQGKPGGNGMGGGGPPGGKRPVGPDKGSKSFDARGKAPFDPKGKKVFEGYAPGQNFKKKTTGEMAEEIKQAAQDAPEALEQQRIPKVARDIAKGYFKNLGGQKEGEEEKK